MGKYKMYFWPTHEEATRIFTEAKRLGLSPSDLTARAMTEWLDEVEAERERQRLHERFTQAAEARERQRLADEAAETAALHALGQAETVWVNPRFETDAPGGTTSLKM